MGCFALWGFPVLAVTLISIKTKNRGGTETAKPRRKLAPDSGQVGMFSLY